MNGLNNFFTNDPLGRRHFLETAGKGFLAAGFLGAIAGCTSNAQKVMAQANLSDTIPVKLPPLDAASEVKPSPTPSPLGKDKRIGFAIVGLGELSLKEIMPAFGESRFAKPVALVSGEADKAAKVASQYDIPAKNIYNYKNFDDIKNNPDIDVVYIVLPNGMHEEFTVRATAAGKHVLCEKPMANSVKEAQNMVDACKKANKKLMIAYRIQYEPANKLAMQWTRNKEFGKVKIIEAYNGQHIGDPSQWRLKKALAGGGSLPDIGLYCLNTCRYLLGEEPEWVLASQYSDPGDIRFKEVEDAMMWQMRFPSGALANCTSHYSAHQSRRYRCLADNGGWFGLDPAFAYSGLRMEVAQVKDGKEWKENPQVVANNQFALELDHMAECIMYNRTPYTPGEEGVQDQKIMEAIYQSAREGKPVKLERIIKIDAFRGTPPPAEG